MRSIMLSLITAIFFAPQLPANTVRAGVLGVYHPHKIELQATTEPLVAHVGPREFVLEPHSRSQSAAVTLAAGGLRFDWNGQSIGAEEVRITSRSQSDASFVLRITGRVQRYYRGTLELRPSAREIVSIVSMDIETAVAMAVAAETNDQAPIEALKAQAVVARSYFLAGKGRHAEFDFCDLTHCQLLRDAPGLASAAVAATTATRGLALAYHGKLFAAMFSRSCGGDTRCAAQIGLHPADYPYFSVDCNPCKTSSRRWTRRLSQQDAEKLLGKGEAGRLAVNRLHGWKTVPSNNYRPRQEGEVVLLQGQGAGHGLGLCQWGAHGMASEGVTFREILRHYFPNTTIEAR